MIRQAIDILILIVLLLAPALLLSVVDPELPADDSSFFSSAPREISRESPPRYASRPAAVLNP